MSILKFKFYSLDNISRLLKPLLVKLLVSCQSYYLWRNKRTDMVKVKALHLLVSAQHLLCLLLLTITSCNSIDVNVIPEIFSRPTNLRDGALYGASLALCPNCPNCPKKFFVGAPFPTTDQTGVFSCNLDTQQCQRTADGLAECEGILNQ